MAQRQDPRQDPTQVHCYSNPSFCKSTEYMLEDNYSENSDLPPPPQFQVDDLPPPPPVLQPQPHYGQNNLAFTGSPEVNVYGQNNPAFNGSPEVIAPPPRHNSVANLNARSNLVLNSGSPDVNLANQLPHHRSVVNLNHTTVDRYCYIDDSVEAPSPPPSASMHKRFGSLPLGGPERRHYAFRGHRYEYIQDDAASQLQAQLQQQQQLQIANANRREYLEHQQIQQRSAVTPQPQHQRTIPSRQNSIRASVRNLDTHYNSLGPEGVEAHEVSQWNEEDEPAWNASRKHINTPKGRYTSVPLQDDEQQQQHQPPSLPERNDTAQRVNSATQKLHEILTTPRKPRGRPQGDPLSPVKGQPMVHSPRGAFTPGCSPSSTAAHRAMNSPSQHPHPQQTPHHQQQQASTPQGRALSPRNMGPMTSTPNKEPPSARRCLPLNESLGGPMVRRHIEDSQYARTGHRYPATEETIYEQHKKQQQALFRGSGENVESAFIARTAVVPPLSPTTSEANTTLVGNAEKSHDRKNAPMILVLVGILTCGLAIYLSWTQGRKYYFDSAIGCGACCALAGACRNMRREWTGLGLAGLAALSCAGLLLLAAKSPRPGTPMHDVTAGALCVVSILGAVLALLALIAPRFSCGRHRRVHNWIPGFSP